MNQIASQVPPENTEELSKLVLEGPYHWFRRGAVNTPDDSTRVRQSAVRYSQDGFQGERQSSMAINGGIRVSLNHMVSKSGMCLSGCGYVPLALGTDRG